jgi:hypothetical protein
MGPILRTQNRGQDFFLAAPVRRYFEMPLD